MATALSVFNFKFVYKIKLTKKFESGINMHEEEEDDAPPSRFFTSRRSKLCAKTTPDELKAASELLEKIQGEKTKVLPDEEKKLPAAKKPKTRKGNKSSPEPEIIIEENEVEEIIETRPKSPEAHLSAAAKRRLNKLKREQQLELKSVEAANEKILSAVDGAESLRIVEEVEENLSPVDHLFVLTITYMSQISRLKCYKDEKFSKIFPKVAELHKLKVSEFLLCHKDTNITVDDTPESLKLTPTDILECIPFKSSTGEEDKSEENENHLKIQFQSSDSKNKTDMVIHKLEKLQDAMERYSKLRNIPITLLAFEFDGEKLAGTEIPLELDMESGNCIDVTVCTSANECASKKSFETVFTVDSDSNDSDILIY